MKRNVKTTKSKITLNTSRQYTELISGANILVTTADARALYDLTTAQQSDPEKNTHCISQTQFTRYEAMRKYLRTISKEILKVSGDVTTIDELLKLHDEPETT